MVAGCYRISPYLPDRSGGIGTFPLVAHRAVLARQIPGGSWLAFARGWLPGFTGPSPSTSLDKGQYSVVSPLLDVSRENVAARTRRRQGARALPCPFSVPDDA